MFILDRSLSLLDIIKVSLVLLLTHLFTYHILVWQNKNTKHKQKRHKFQVDCFISLDRFVEILCIPNLLHLRLHNRPKRIYELYST